METKLDYYRRRAAEEYLAHANAAHAEARKSHLDLAKHFEALALGAKIEQATEAHPVQVLAEPPAVS